MKVAMLGTGKMGAAIAHRLAGAGHDVALWNRTRSRAEAVGAGRVAATPGEAASGADVVLSIVFDAAAVRDVYGQLAPQPGQVFVEMSTAGPALPADLAPAIESAGAHLLACPIVGSIPAIEAASARLLVGGDEPALERARPVLETFGEPQHVGTREQAAGLKLVNNAMLGACSVVASELLATAERSGLDPEAAFGLLTRLMPYLETRRRGYLGRDHANPLFELRGIRKDLDLALGLGHSAGAPMPAVGAVREIYALAEAEFGGDEMTAVIEPYLRDAR
jgi:3-hydroxyisobutyrate dehydrogenase/2-hydroxy-3-oxopropionate reductase